MPGFILKTLNNNNFRIFFVNDPVASDFIRHKHIKLQKVFIFSFYNIIVSNWLTNIEGRRTGNNMMGHLMKKKFFFS